jgi:hypothetical protein
MNTKSVLDLKPFLPAKDYAVSKQFYLDLGFTIAWTRTRGGRTYETRKSPRNIPALWLSLRRCRRGAFAFFTSAIPRESCGTLRTTASREQFGRYAGPTRKAHSLLPSRSRK